MTAFQIAKCGLTVLGMSMSLALLPFVASAREFSPNPESDAPASAMQSTIVTTTQSITTMQIVTMTHIITSTTTSSAVSPDVSITRTNPSDIEPDSVGVALKGLDVRGFDSLELHPVQVMTVPAGLGAASIISISQQLTGVLTLEMVLVHAGQDIFNLPLNSWRLFYAPPATKLTSPTSWREFAAYRIESLNGDDLAEDIQFGSNFRITETVPVTVSGSLPTTLTGWVTLLDNRGVSNIWIARLLFRHEVNGRTEHVLIVSSHDVNGDSGDAPDGDVVCSANRRGYFWCRFRRWLRW